MSANQSIDLNLRLYLRSTDYKHELIHSLTHTHAHRHTHICPLQRTHLHINDMKDNLLKEKVSNHPTLTVSEILPPMVSRSISAKTEMIPVSSVMLKCTGSPEPADRKRRWCSITCIHSLLKVTVVTSQQLSSWTLTFYAVDHFVVDPCVLVYG